MKCFTFILGIYWEAIQLPSGQTFLPDDFPPKPQMSDIIVNSQITSTVGCTGRDVGLLHSEG